MFDALSEKLQATLADVRGHGTLTEADIDKAMRDIRLALLEADVNFKVVKSFTATVKERCLGADVLGTLNPGQQVVKIVNEELAALMGGASRGVIAVDNTLSGGDVVDPVDERDRVMAAFNAHVHADDRTESLVLSVRDGVTLIRLAA